MFLKKLMALEMKRLILIMMIVGSIMLIGTMAQAIKDETLVLYLPFDEGSGKKVKDLSQYGNDGEIVGDAKWVDGKYGKALQFTKEGDHVEVKSSDSLKLNDQMGKVEKPILISFDLLPLNQRSVLFHKSETEIRYCFLMLVVDWQIHDPLWSPVNGGHRRICQSDGSGQYTDYQLTIDRLLC